MNENVKINIKDRIKYYEPKSNKDVASQSKNKPLNIHDKKIVEKSENNLNKYPMNFNDYEKITKNIIHPIKGSKIIECVENNGQKLDIYHYLNKNILTCGNNRSIGILFVGQSGAGKSTLINAYTNFLLGVNYNQPCRYKIVIENKEKEQTKSQTEEITVYTIQSPLYPGIIFKLIDTPGIGDTDTENIETESRINKNLIYKKYLEKFEDFFSGKLLEKEAGLTLAICFVVKALENRITNYQKEIFSNIMNLFGKNIVSNFLAIFTHSDTEEPNAKQVLTRVIEEFRKKEEKKEKWYWCFSSRIFFENTKRKFFSNIYNDNLEKFVFFTKEIIKLKIVDITLTKQNLYLNKKLNDLKKYIINELLFGLLNNSKTISDKDKIDEINNNLEKQIIGEAIKMKIIIDEINKIKIQGEDNKSFEKQLFDVFEDNNIFIKNNDKLEPILKKIISILKTNEEKILKEYNINKNDLIDRK